MSDDFVIFDLEMGLADEHDIPMKEISDVELNTSGDFSIRSSLKSNNDSSKPAKLSMNNVKSQDRYANPSSSFHTEAKTSISVGKIALDSNKSKRFGPYELGKQIGKGSYGTVWEAFHLGTREKVAIKRVYIGNDMLKAKRLLREIRALKCLKSHPNVVNLLDVFMDPDWNSVSLVFEFAMTDCYRLQGSSIFFKEKDVQRAMFQIILGTAAIHQSGIIHRDLKPANILLAEGGILKICDFGLARGILPEKRSTAPFDVKVQSQNISLDQIRNNPLSITGGSPFEECKQKPTRKHQRKLTMHVVTRWYRPPEVILLHHHYDHALDMWSLGCIMGDFLSMMKLNCSDPGYRGPLFPGDCCYPLTDERNSKHSEHFFDQLNVIFSIIGSPSEEDLTHIVDSKAKDYIRMLPSYTKRNLTDLFPGTSALALNLLEGMLHFNPKKRLSAYQALNHPFFDSIRPNQHDMEFYMRPMHQISFDFEENSQSVQDIKRSLI